MLYSLYLLRDAIVRVKSISDSILRQIEKPKATFKEDAVRNNALAALMDIQTAVDELGVSDIADQHTVSRLIGNLPYILEDFNTANTIEEVRDALNQITDIMNTFDLYDHYNEYIMPYHCIDYGHRCREIDNGILHEDNVAQYFINNLHTQSRPLKVFEMNTRSGRAGRLMKEAQGSNIELYGADIYNELMATNRSLYYRTISGELKGARVRITPNAFDAIYLDPVISWTREANITSSSLVNAMREEQTQLIKATGYLREGGVLAFVLPRYRIYRNTATYLATHYEDIQVLTSREDVRYHGPRMVMIMGKKRVSQTGERLQPDARYYNMLRNLCSSMLPEGVVLNANDLNCYTLPTDEITIENFRGAKLSEEEALHMMMNSAATSNFWKDQTPVNSEITPKHPLLPFTVGQLGLVLTSGVLDGIVDEGDGHYHVVRGRNRKYKSPAKDEEKVLPNGRIQIERTSVTSNIVELSVIGPDGSYKKLAG